jgi:hypothetical protein
MPGLLPAEEERMTDLDYDQEHFHALLQSYITEAIAPAPAGDTPQAA